MDAFHDQFHDRRPVGHAVEEVVAVMLVDQAAVHADRLGALGGGSQPECAVSAADNLADAIAALDAGGVDAVLVDAASPQAAAQLHRLRSASTEAAIVVVRGGDDVPIPLDPQAVGVQTTLDLAALDDTALLLTLRLAIERHRLARATEVARAQAQALTSTNPSRDPLTGLPCGERLLEEVDRFVADAIRFARPLTVALVEVDIIESLRRTRGDALADCMLIHAAGLLDQCLRNSDVLGRLVDDQLLVAMPGTGGKAAITAARRIQAHLADHPYVAGGLTHAVSTSFGISPLAGLMPVDELVFRADSALGSARESGPGTIHVAGAVALQA